MLEDEDTLTLRDRDPNHSYNWKIIGSSDEDALERGVRYGWVGEGSAPRGRDTIKVIYDRDGQGVCPWELDWDNL